MNVDRLQQLLIFLEKFPLDSFTLYSVAYEYMQASNWNKAIEYFERLRQHDPSYVGLYYHLGKIQEHLDQIEEAFSTYESGMQVAKDKSDTHALSELERAWKRLKEEEEWS
ncbi:MAG: tetratricopeptide repeat protein [Bacteroidota bacterium]